MGQTIITEDGRFEWDEDKNALNIQKHGIDFNFAKKVRDFLAGWYKSSERAKHPHHQKLKVECSLDDDVIRWLKGKTNEDEEYPMYINYYLRKIIEQESRII